MSVSLMEYNEYLRLTERLTSRLINDPPVFSFTEEELSSFRKSLGSDTLSALYDAGLYDGDFEKFCFVYRLCEETGVWEDADTEFLRALFTNAKKHIRAEFLNDPYIKNIRIPYVKEGDVTLMNAVYDKGEAFLYDMPDLFADVVFPKIGYFDERVYFPAVYEKEMPWVSVCPSEINSMKDQVSSAHGKTLVLGLGLGYYAYAVSEKEEVRSVTVIEINPTITGLFEKHILPQFARKDKIRVITSDAVAFLENVSLGEYDFVFADIWEGQEDGAPLYKKIKTFEKNLPGTEFTYWIEDQIRWYSARNKQ